MICKKLLVVTLWFFSPMGWVVAQQKSDSLQLSQGRELFRMQCSACHDFQKDGIGPPLGGLTAVVSKDWIMSFIKNPKAKIDSKDKRAVAMLKKYNSYMPSFEHLSKAEMQSILALIETQPAPKPPKFVPTIPDLTDPIPQKIEVSDLVVGLELFTEIPFSSPKLPRTRIVKMNHQPQTKNNFILDLRGKLYQLNGKEPVLYFDMAANMPHFIHQPGLATGFGSFAFHPEFTTNGLLYTTHTEKPNIPADFAYSDSIKVELQWVISEWKTTDPLNAKFTGTRRELFRINMIKNLHGVQDICFNPNAKKGDEDYALLYIGVGDGGSAESGFLNLTRNLDKIWGTVLRIDPRGNNSSNGRYGIPASNPFSKTTHLKEIYAYGFRNPNRIVWTKDNKMLVTNIGHKYIESVNLVLAGHDYGWPIREGTFLIYPEYDLNKIYPLPANDKKYNITYPVVQFDHDESNAIVGGFEYLGKKQSAFEGKYIFGNITSGRLFYVNVKDMMIGKQAKIQEWRIAIDGKPTTLEELTKTNRVDLRFGQDHEGELYIMTKPDGKVYKLIL